MENFVNYFEEMPRRNSRNDAYFVSGTVMVDSQDAALHLLGITDENVSAQMKRFKNSGADIANLVDYYNGHIRELLQSQIYEGVFMDMDLPSRINERNREVSKGYVHYLAKQMENGKFNTVSPQGLVFYVYTDEKKRNQRMLIDGQNRLLAALVSRAVVEFHTQLTDNLDIFSVLDQGKFRTASTVANNAVYEKAGPVASLLQKDMPYLATLVLEQDPKKDGELHVKLFSYLKNSYVDNGARKCSLLDALYESINDESFMLVLKNRNGGINQVFVAGMMRALIEAIETGNADAQRHVFAVVKQLADMLRGDMDMRHAYELDRIEPYLNRIFKLSNETRGHRIFPSRLFYALFSSIVFNRKDGFNAMMNRLEEYRDDLMDEDKFKHVMSITTTKTKNENAILMDNDGNLVYLVHDILTQDLKDDLQHFEPYRNLILTRNVDMDDAA